MDDVFERMLAFRQALITFAQHLDESLADTSRHHDHIDGMWNDSTRRQYDDAWAPLQETVDSFLKQDCPTYVEFLDQKLSALNDYLHGRR
jgi:hypothetical protein